MRPHFLPLDMRRGVEPNKVEGVRIPSGQQQLLRRGNRGEWGSGGLPPEKSLNPYPLDLMETPPKIKKILSF